MREYDDMLPVSLMNDHNREVFILVDRHNDHVADFNWARDDHECQRIVELINTNDAALRRAKAEGEDELLKLRIYTQTLQRALRNCHMLARRIVVSESAFFKIDSAHHIIRMCEEAGIIQDGVLRDDARAAQIEEGE